MEPEQLGGALLTEGALTCDDLSEFWVQVDRAGQEGSNVSGCEDGSPGRQEHLKAANISIDLQQGLHVFGGGDVLGHPERTDTLTFQLLMPLKAKPQTLNQQSRC